MPLSLRRSQKASHPTSADRTISNPTLLHRLRSSAFNSSKASLISTLGYDTVRSRTPPRTDLCPRPDDRLVTRRTRELRAIQAGWRIAAQRLSKVEQRECLLAAECLNIVDPLAEVTGSPDVSVESVIVISGRSIPVIEEELPSRTSETDTVIYAPYESPYHTVPSNVGHSSRSLTSLFRHPAFRNRRPLTSTYTSTRSPLAPCRTDFHQNDPTPSPALTTVPRQAIIRPFGSPVMAPLKPPSTPRPRSPTPDRMSSPPTSPGWTHITSQPQPDRWS